MNDSFTTNQQQDRRVKVTPKRTSDHELRLTLKKLFAKRRVRATIGLGLAAAVAFGLGGVGQTLAPEAGPVSTPSTPPVSKSATITSSATKVELDNTASQEIAETDSICAEVMTDTNGPIYIHLEVSPDEYVSGIIEHNFDGSLTTEFVDGALGNSQFHLVITSPDGSERMARWWFDTDGIELEDGMYVPFTGCVGSRE